MKAFEQILRRVERKITRVVLTGGPAGGKTSALAFFTKRFTAMGFRVFVVPEAATLVFGSGIRPFAGTGRSKGFTAFDLQELILQRSLEAEKMVLDFALRWNRTTGQRCIIFYDRGLFDGRAYATESEFTRVLKSCGLTMADMYHRYDAVIHLQSTAIDTEFYQTENNPQRTETRRQAARKDELTRQAWMGAPHHTMIVNHNCPSFDIKLQRAFSAVCRAMSIPEPIEQERKFLVSLREDSALFLTGRTAHLAQTYLLAPDGCERRVRMMRWVGARKYDSIYFITEKRPVGPSVRSETEYIITSDDYARLLTAADPHRIQVVKRRTFSTVGSTPVEYDTFMRPLWAHTLISDEGATGTLEQEFRFDGQSEMRFPRWLKCIREVTGEKAFSNSELALRQT